MGYGRSADRFAGAMSRLLHLRGAKENTIGYLHQYLDLAPDQLFPVPKPITDLRIQRTLLDRAMRTSTLTWTSTHEVVCSRYRRRHESEYKKNLVAHARWIRPAGEQRKTALIYVHGWLEPGSWAEESTLFRKWSRELSVDILHVALPFHGSRKPKEALFSGEFFWTADLVRSMEGVRQAACDTRALMAWLRNHGYERVGVTGISLGGAITMLLACLTPTPDFVVPIISHLELEAAVEEAPILWRMKADLERWGIDAEQRRDLFRRLGLSSALPKLAPERQLWIQAREDVYIDAALAEAQWTQWGEPNILWIEGGHMTFPLHIDRITQRIDDFLASF
ncbi:MAG: alpha/beta hydrolase family protein [Myxococcales bacterium]|nr:alpha/beta hydrolase family protein [Myxococcales bacterium]MCB9576099.1 alpha/beta hydrolase family protein [Polyangiaceae bacterium]